MESVLIKVERTIHAHEWVIGRVIIRGEIKGFCAENKNDDVNNPTLPPCGTYPLRSKQSTELSRQFYYNDKTNQLIGRKDYFKLSDRKDWRPHDLIHVEEIPKVGSVVVCWGMEGIGNHTLVVGNVIGFIDGEEKVVQNRYNYITIYPILYPLIRDNKYAIEYLSVH